MATAKSTRSERARARSPASYHSAARKIHPRARGGLVEPSRALGADQFRQLSLVMCRLRAIYGTTITAELALRQQAGEQNSEVADCLRAGVCDPIAQQIRALEEVTAHSSVAESRLSSRGVRRTRASWRSISSRRSAAASGAVLSGARGQKRRRHP